MLGPPRRGAGAGPVAGPLFQRGQRQPRRCDYLVASSTIYGGTFNLLAHSLHKMGIECSFVSPFCGEDELDAAFRPTTKCVIGETVANPALTVLDIERFAAAAHAYTSR